MGVVAQLSGMYSLLISLAAILIATKLLGELARRAGQPSVLGELLAGVILGGSALALLDPRDPAMHGLGELGLFVLIFQIGLHTDVRSLRRVGASAIVVAVAGVVLPFAGGFFAARALGVPVLAAVIAGASLTATSMAISARVLGDKGALRTKEAHVVLGAALADDVIGLIILSVVAALAEGTSVSVAGVARVSAVSVGFIAVALAGGRYAIPPLFRVLDKIRANGALGILGIAFGLLLAGVAAASGTAMIIGAFVAGMILHPTPHRHEIERATAQIGHFLVPVFFAVVGASVDLVALASRPALEAGAALVAVGVAGKVLAGFAPWRFKGNKLLIGVAMVPRGEVGLIFAQMGLATGAITPQLFAAIMMMVIVTTFLTPPLLGAVIRRDDSIDREDPETGDVRKTGGRRQTAVGRRH
jgi:Kef-type K+ transport system membrane component KefB